MCGALRNKYTAMVEAMLEAAKKAGHEVSEEELYTSQETLARCTVLLANSLYAELPAGAPRFKDLPLMMARLMLCFMLDEAHTLITRRGAAEAVWVPLVCGSEIGGRGDAPLQLLPGFHVMFSLSNTDPDSALDAAVREAGEWLLTPRPATTLPDGTRAQPPLELQVGDDGVHVWDASMLRTAVSCVAHDARQLHTEALKATVPDPGGSPHSRLAPTRVVCAVDANSEEMRAIVQAVTYADEAQRGTAATPDGDVQLDEVSVHTALFADSVKALMAEDPRTRATAIRRASVTVAGDVAERVRQRPELVRRGKVYISLAGVNEPADVVLGLVTRGSVTVASPGARRVAAAPPLVTSRRPSCCKRR